MRATFQPVTLGTFLSALVLKYKSRKVVTIPRML